MHLQIRSQSYPGLHHKRGKQQGEGRNCFIQLRPHKALSGELCPGLGTPEKKEKQEKKEKGKQFSESEGGHERR